VLAGSPPLENQKHTPMAVFLAFSGSPPPQSDRFRLEPVGQSKVLAVPVVLNT